MAKLGDICTIVSGTTPKSSNPDYWDGNVNWVTPAELTDETDIIYESKRKITQQAVKETHLKSFPAGTVLLSSRAPIGKVAIAGTEMYCNQGFKNLICSEDIYNRYLYYFLKDKTDYLNSLGRGATFKEISKSIVEDIDILLPSIEDQHQRAEKLDAISRLIEKRKKQLNKFDELVKSRFVEMFGDIKSNDKEWKIVDFKASAKIDTNMIHDFREYENYPHIGIDSIEKETGKLVGYRTIAEDGVISGKYLFTPKHIIYSKIRPNLNKVALPDFEGLCSADAYPILPREDVCNRVYLGYTLRSECFLDYILAFSNRTNLPKVNKKQVEGFKFSLPPLDLQNQFADFVTQVDKSKLAVQKSLEQLEILKKSLMQAYFG